MAVKIGSKMGNAPYFAYVALWLFCRHKGEANKNDGLLMI